MNFRIYSSNWVNMIIDTLGALALATEPPNDGPMKRPQVGRGENFITRTNYVDPWETNPFPINVFQAQT